ncbi:MAG TPA: hypothetical protein VI911_04145 [Patescibacteria group bacterium]|nr:hypothetical protein [Patescibacteria group bacterium]
MIRIRLPLRVSSRTNARQHWSVRARRTKAERALTALHLAPLRHQRPDMDDGVTVELVRVAPRALDDDNVREALKAVRDEVAHWLGCDDADPRVTWTYHQRAEGVRVYAVDVTVRRTS